MWNTLTKHLTVNEGIQTACLCLAVEATGAEPTRHSRKRVKIGNYMCALCNVGELCLCYFDTCEHYVWAPLPGFAHLLRVLKVFLLVYAEC